MIFKNASVFGLILALFGFSFGASGASPVQSVSSGKTLKTREDVLEDFRNFLTSFGSSNEFRRASMDTVISVHRLVIDLADQKSPYEVTKVKADQILADFCDTGVVKHLEVSWTNWKGAEAKYENEKFPEKCIRFSFIKINDGWFLKTIYNDKIELKDSTVVRNDAKINSCLNVARKYFALAEKDAVTDYYNRALYANLCAAQNGSGQAAITANGLAGSGMSRSYSNDMEMELVKRGIREGYAGAYESMAYLECGYIRDSTGHLVFVTECKNPKTSYSYLAKAISLGHKDAIYILGCWLETGKLGRVDLQGAMSCFKLASEQGDERGTEGLKMSAAGLARLKVSSSACPINDFFPNN